VAGFVNAIAARCQVIVPIHPGFAGAPRPDWFNGVDDLALAYLDLIEQRDLHDVMVVGFSMGGWIAAEMGVRNNGRLGSLVIVDGAGIYVEGHPIADVFPLAPNELMALSYHDPARFQIDPATVTPEQAAARAANFKALEVYGRAQEMHDPKLRRRLARVKIPALVVWGESDGVIDTEYGRAFAASFPNAQFAVVPEAGHLPQIEQPDRLLNLVWDFMNRLPVGH
jgi:pimeloyl-ACP methyl ester carboxylesterase